MGKLGKSKFQTKVKEPLGSVHDDLHKNVVMNLNPGAHYQHKEKIGKIGN